MQEIFANNAHPDLKKIKECAWEGVDVTAPGSTLENRSVLEYVFRKGTKEEAEVLMENADFIAEERILKAMCQNANTTAIVNFVLFSIFYRGNDIFGVQNYFSVFASFRLLSVVRKGLEKHPLTQGLRLDACVRAMFKFDSDFSTDSAIRKFINFYSSTAWDESTSTALLVHLLAGNSPDPLSLQQYIEDNAILGFEQSYIYSTLLSFIMRKNSKQCVGVVLHVIKSVDFMVMDKYG